MVCPIGSSPPPGGGKVMVRPPSSALGGKGTTGDVGTRRPWVALRGGGAWGGGVRIGGMSPGATGIGMPRVGGRRR